MNLVRSHPQVHAWPLCARRATPPVPPRCDSISRAARGSTDEPMFALLGPALAHPARDTGRDSAVHASVSFRRTFRGRTPRKPAACPPARPPARHAGVHAAGEAGRRSVWRSVQGRALKQVVSYFAKRIFENIFCVSSLPPTCLPFTNTFGTVRWLVIVSSSLW